MISKSPFSSSLRSTKKIPAASLTSDVHKDMHPTGNNRGEWRIFFLSLSLLGNKQGETSCVLFTCVSSICRGTGGSGGNREELILLPVSAHLLTAPKPILTDTVFIKMIFSFILPAG